MFATTNRRPDFSDTLAALPPSRVPDAADALAQLDEAERADLAVLRLVACAAVATLVLATAGSLVF